MKKRLTNERRTQILKTLPRLVIPTHAGKDAWRVKKVVTPQAEDYTYSFRGEPPGELRLRIYQDGTCKMLAVSGFLKRAEKINLILNKATRELNADWHDDHR